MSINRAAEAMTIFAVICAATIPAGSHGPSLAWASIGALPFPNAFGSLWANFQLATALGRVRDLDVLHRITCILVHRSYS